MSESVIFALLITASVAIIGVLIYSALRPPEQVILYDTSNQGPRFETQWWGYGWRPFWRRYDGLPGLTPKSTLTMPLKPIIIPKS